MKNLRVRYLFFIVLIMNVRGWAQYRVTPIFKRAVAFIYAEDRSSKLIPQGSGFYCGFPIDSVYDAGYIVTAKHVLKKENGSFLDKITLRVPLKQNSSLQNVPIPLRIT